MFLAARSFSILALFIFISSCTVYRSSDRKRFETDSAAAAAIQINNFVSESCSSSSTKDFAQASKLIKVFNSSHDGTSVFLWEHIVDDISYLETDNLKGVYCLYE